MSMHEMNDEQTPTDRMTDLAVEMIGKALVTVAPHALRAVFASGIVSKEDVLRWLDDIRAEGADEATKPDLKALIDAALTMGMSEDAVLRVIDEELSGKVEESEPEHVAPDAEMRPSLRADHDAGAMCTADALPMLVASFAQYPPTCESVDAVHAAKREVVTALSRLNACAADLDQSMASERLDRETFSNALGAYFGALQSMAVRYERLRRACLDLAVTDEQRSAIENFMPDLAA